MYLKSSVTRRMFGCKWRSIERTGGPSGVRCEEWGCGCWAAEIVGLNPSEDIDVHPL
jgi:hypothetical protein